MIELGKSQRLMALFEKEGSKQAGCAKWVFSFFFLLACMNSSLWSQVSLEIGTHNGLLGLLFLRDEIEPTNAHRGPETIKLH